MAKKCSSTIIAADPEAARALSQRNERVLDDAALVETEKAIRLYGWTLSAERLIADVTRDLSAFLRCADTMPVPTIPVNAKTLRDRERETVRVRFEAWNRAGDLSGMIPEGSIFHGVIDRAVQLEAEKERAAEAGRVLAEDGLRALVNELMKAHGELSGRLERTAAGLAARVQLVEEAAEEFSRKADAIVEAGLDGRVQALEPIVKHLKARDEMGERLSQMLTGKASADEAIKEIVEKIEDVSRATTPEERDKIMRAGYAAAALYEAGNAANGTHPKAPTAVEKTKRIIVRLVPKPAEAADASNDASDA